MIELAREDYHKALPQLDQVKINTMFAKVVLEQHIPGRVYADCRENPRAFYVAHPYRMSLLFGDSGDDSFTHGLYDYITNQSAARDQMEWLQADPAGEWSRVIDSMLTSHNRRLENCGLSPEDLENNKILRNTRVNFSFDRNAYLDAKRNFPKHEEPVVRMTEEFFFAQSGSVVPRFFWRDAGHFAEKGVGYSLLREGEVASTSFSAFLTASQLEIGIETADAHRGQGYATSVCSALIDYCLDRNLEPVWACRLENKGSYNLAHKLGFRPSVTLPYYRLPI
ncbi:RimJ/RimL family protein N-acetyltransferase [Paenibacillus forsythiae]|uniref:RimJ/RimL family protein N-acetyltransferase n=1 Tax=Paenibacillus forsythiae TaxID=365616 RepID=A0ABU3H5W8_9BACL|nr:GNAT family N-acetyltransferase [Paenibacillus forsythiae]MDT3426213.1 RimJ/RimL family protein N-acetyltransferase [Paenibacillus forsythiae]